MADYTLADLTPQAPKADFSLTELEQPTQPTATPFQQAMKGFTSWLGKGITSLPTPVSSATEIPVQPTGTEQAPTGAAAPAMSEFLGNIIPQTEAQALGMAATAGAGGLAAKIGMRTLPAIATRVGGAMLGGGTGAKIAGQDFGPAALESGGAALSMEAGGALLSKLFRLGGGKAIMAKDARNIGAKIGEQVPELAGASTPADLADVAHGAASRAKIAKPLQDFERLYGRDDVFVPTLDSTNTMTVSEVLKELRNLGEKGYGTKPDVLALQARGHDVRALRGNAQQELKTNLGDPAIVPPHPGHTSALDVYNSANETYSKGKSLIDMLKNSGVVKRGTAGGVAFDTQKLQNYISNRRATLANYLGPDEFADLANTITRGAPLGAEDVPRLHGGLYSYLRDLFRTQYAGAPQPFAVPPAAQTTADILAERKPRETALAGAAGATGLYRLLGQELGRLRYIH